MESCQKCKKTLSKKGSHFLCQGPCQGTFHRSCVKGLAADMKAGKDRHCCNNCEENETEDEGDDEEAQDMNKTLKAILKKVNVLPGLEKQLNDIKQSMSVLSDKYDSLLAEHEKSKEKIIKLEKATASTINKCIYLEKCNLALEQRLHEFEQATRKHNIEIAGIEQLPGENAMDIVTKIGTQINASCDNIESAKRSHTMKSTTKPAPIIVGFKTTGTEARDEWLARRRQLTDVTSKTITGGAMTNKIYINEDLTKTARALLWNAKKQLLGVFKYVWVSNGKILVKKADDGNATWIKSENDIYDLLKPSLWAEESTCEEKPLIEEDGPLPSSPVLTHLSAEGLGVRRAHALMGAGASGSGGGGRAARALRLLLLLVLALAAVEYLFGSILDASPLRTYLYTPLYNATQPTIRSSEHLPWPKRLSTSFASTQIPVTRKTTPNSTKVETKRNETTQSPTNPPLNMTRQEPEDSTPLLISKIMDSIKLNIKNLVSTESVEFKKNDTEMPLCELPPDLGPIPVNKTDMDLDVVEKKFPEVHWGGRYSPPNCTARHKVAIIVPYRDRQEHLAIFLNHMHPFLMKQQIEYGIFIVEQEGNHEFNRAKLMNVGFVESQKQKAGGWGCFIFHDIDLLPLDQRNLYSCPRQPRHMSASIDKLNFRLPYEDIFGGVSAMTLEQFRKVNGFSNRYWGWGGEDDDMSYRLKKMNYHVARYKMSIARYAMLDHKKSAPNPKRYQLLSQTSKTFKKDGLSTLEYVLVDSAQHHLYTHILANIDEHS